jgi:hypothetical protein
MDQSPVMGFNPFLDHFLIGLFNVFFDIGKGKFAAGHQLNVNGNCFPVGIGNNDLLRVFNPTPPLGMSIVNNPSF